MNPLKLFQIADLGTSAAALTKRQVVRAMDGRYENGFKIESLSNKNVGLR